MTRRVVVTGMGMISPLGHNVAQTWDSIVAGKSGVGLITRPLIRAAAQTEINGRHVEAGLIGHHPIDPGDDIRAKTDPTTAQHANGYQSGIRGNAARALAALADNNARYLSAVSVFVLSDVAFVCSVGETTTTIEAVLSHNLGRQVRVSHIDAGVQDGYVHPRAGNPQILMDRISMDQGRTRCQSGFNRQVERHTHHIRLSRQSFETGRRYFAG